MEQQDWESKPEVKKGNIGERIVQEYLEGLGFIMYKCITKKAHAFDFLAIRNKERFVIAEVKSYARMNYYKATGINKKHFDDYWKIYQARDIDVLLFFVDEHPDEERVYFGKLSVLTTAKAVNGVKYPMIMKTKNKGDKILFSLSDMKEVCKLDADQLAELRKHSRRSYDYD